MQEIRKSLPISSYLISFRIKSNNNKTQQSIESNSLSTVDGKINSKKSDRYRTDFESPLRKLYFKQALCNSRVNKKTVNLSNQLNSKMQVKLVPPCSQNQDKKKRRNQSFMNILRRKQELRSKNLVERIDRNIKYESIVQIAERWRNQLIGPKNGSRK